MQDMKTPLDTIIGSVAVSSPLWYQWIETGLGVFMLIGGAALLCLRLAIAWREWKTGHKKK